MQHEKVFLDIQEQFVMNESLNYVRLELKLHLISTHMEMIVFHIIISIP
jgi:hypothetical protein